MTGGNVLVQREKISFLLKIPWTILGLLQTLVRLGLCAVERLAGESTIARAETKLASAGQDR